MKLIDPWTQVLCPALSQIQPRRSNLPITRNIKRRPLLR